MKIILIVATTCQILTLKCTKLDFGSMTPGWCGGGLAAPPLLQLQSTQCREAAKYVLIRLHCTSKNAFVRLSVEFEPPGTLCFYSDAQPLAGLQGPYKGRGPPS